MDGQKIEQATERVQLLASPELLAQLKGGWTGPVEMRVRPPAPGSDTWDMDVRECEPEGQFNGW